MLTKQRSSSLLKNDGYKVMVDVYLLEPLKAAIKTGKSPAEVNRGQKNNVARP